MVQFNFSPTKEDYLKGFRVFYLSNWSKLIVPIVLSLLMSLCYGAALILGSIPFNLSSAFLLIIFILFFVMFGLILVIGPLKVANQVEKDERLNCPVSGEANEEHILLKTQFVETKLDWGSFQKVIESKEHFLLVQTVNKNMFQIIPKRAFNSLEDEKAFKNLLDVKIHAKPKPVFSFKNFATLRTVIIIGLLMLVCLVAAISYFYNSYMAY